MSSGAPAHFELNVQLTPRDLYNASRAITRNQLGKSWFVLSFISILFGVGALFFLVAKELGMKLLAPVSTFWSVLILPAFMLYLYYVAPYITARSMLKQSANLRNAIHYVISDGGITLEAATARSDLQWATFTKAQETRDFFLLYIRKSAATILLKSAFASKDEISQFRELLRRHVKNVSLRPTS